MTDTDHISLEDLAALAEGRCDPQREAAQREHLAQCRRCFAAYAEAVRFQSAWLADPQAFAPTAEMLRQGRAIAGSSRTTPRPARLRARPLTLAVPALAAAVLVAVLWVPTLFPTDDHLDEGTLACIQSAIAGASQRGMILPAGEIFTPGAAQVYRSGTGPDQDELTAAIEDLARRHHEGPPSRAMAFWLVAGQVAAGQLDNARAYAAEARRHYPDDLRFAALEAIIAYRQSDLERAEQALRSIARQDSSYAIALFNLGYLLAEEGRDAEAKRFLQATARAAAPGGALEMRAAETLKAIEQR